MNTVRPLWQHLIQSHGDDAQRIGIIPRTHVIKLRFGQRFINNCVIFIYQIHRRIHITIAVINRQRTALNVDLILHHIE